MREITNNDASSRTLMQVSSLLKTLISSKAIDREELLSIISDERQQYTLPDRAVSFLGIEEDVHKESERLLGLIGDKVLPHVKG